MNSSKARHPSAEYLCLTRNELIRALNNPGQWILAYVQVKDGVAEKPIYRKDAFHDGIPFEASTFKVAVSEIDSSPRRGDSQGSERE